MPFTYAAGPSRTKGMKHKLTWSTKSAQQTSRLAFAEYVANSWPVYAPPPGALKLNLNSSCRPAVHAQVVYTVSRVRASSS